MSSALEKLNLRPQERRWLVGVLAVVFALLNVWLVWPHFKDWERVKGDLNKAQDTLDKFRAQAAKLPGYQQKERELTRETPDVPADETSIQLQRVASQLANRTGLLAQNYTPGLSRGARNNDFFDEKTLSINYNSTGDTNLVEFLVGISSGENSMIRVRTLTVKPDTGGHKLMGSMLLVASYQREQKAVALAPPTGGKKK